MWQDISFGLCGKTLALVWERWSVWQDISFGLCGKTLALVCVARH